MLELDMAQRRLLAASAHHLNPIVMIGKGGLTANIINELDRSLSKHELIKVKVLDDDRAKRTSLLEQICQSLNAAPIRQIGKILIIYRPEPDEKNDEGISPTTTKKYGSRSKSTRREKKSTRAGK